jgi:hypothetical protein
MRSKSKKPTAYPDPDRMLRLELNEWLGYVVHECIFGSKRLQCEEIAKRRRVRLTDVLVETIAESLCKTFGVRSKPWPRRAVNGSPLRQMMSKIGYAWFYLLHIWKSVFRPQPVIPAHKCIRRGAPIFRRPTGHVSSCNHDEWQIFCAMAMQARHVLEHFEQEPQRSQLAKEAERRSQPLSQLVAEGIAEAVLRNYVIDERDQSSHFPV